MKKLFVTCALIIAAIVIAPATASAQATGDVDVAITVNGFVILYYYDTVNISIPSAVMAQALADADANGGVASTLTADATSTGAGALNVGGAALGGGLTTDQLLTIENAWSIRGLVDAANAVDVTVDTFVNLTSASSGSITINPATSGCARVGGCTGLTPSLGAPLSGNVELGLNFTGITGTGIFNSAATYRITANIV